MHPGAARQCSNVSGSRRGARLVGELGRRPADSYTYRLFLAMSGHLDLVPRGWEGHGSPARRLGRAASPLPDLLVAGLSRGLEPPPESTILMSATMRILWAVGLVVR